MGVITSSQHLSNLSTIALHLITHTSTPICQPASCCGFVTFFTCGDTIEVGDSVANLRLSLEREDMYVSWGR